MSYWFGKRVLVTGGAGFVGSHLVDALLERGAIVKVPRSMPTDLRHPAHANRVVGEVEPDVVFHLAANCGGIGKNKAHPATLLQDNALMGINIVNACVNHSVQKLVTLGTVCMYPKFAVVPFVEDWLFNGRPEETNEAYGTAKRMLYIYLKAVREEFGVKYPMVIPTNMYGPRDHFDLEDSHVIPALIRKFIEAGDGPVMLWGTGQASRDFLYVTDCVEALLLIGEEYDGVDPINLGNENEVKISDLATMIQRIVGHRGEIIWDSSKPDGQPRRCVRAEAAKALGWVPTVRLQEGLWNTIDWYMGDTSWELPDGVEL